MTTEPAPTAESARSTGGFERRTGVPLWIAGIAGASVIVAGLAGSALAVLITAQRAPVAAAAPADQSLTTNQASSQACNAFTLASRQWVEAYRAWLPAVSTPGWQWGDRPVAEATSRFSTAEAAVVTQLDSLVSPNTPPALATAIRGYTNALLEFSAGHGQSTAAQIDQQENQIDDASDDVNQLCARVA
jgi:hypothetical protein